MADVLKSFLVSLNYKVDEASKKNFEQSADKAEKSISALTKTMTVAAIAFAAGVVKIASDLEKMQFMSQRVGASSGNIKSFQYAISQMGGSAAEAAGSLESLAQKLRTSPGYYGLLNRLGVQTKDAKGGLRDTVDIVDDLTKSLRSMPYYKANAYANVLGIDERTLLAIQDGSLTEQMDKYKKMRASVGLGTGSAGEGHAFMQQVRDYTTMFGLIMEKLGVQGAKVLLPLLTRMNQAAGTLVGWFNKLDPQTKRIIQTVSSLALLFGGLAGVIGLVSGGIKIASAAMGVFSIGMGGAGVAAVTALITAIGLLWDDFKVWKEGGKSFIDWSKWEPGINAAIKSLKELDAWLTKVQKSNGTMQDVWKNTAQKRDQTIKYVSDKASAVSSYLGNLIGRGEGGYNSYNRGHAGDARGKKIDFSKMTVGEVMAQQSLPKNDPNRLFAVGKYQFIPSTLKESINGLGIDKNSNFTPELQEKLFNDYIIKKKKSKVKDFITGKGDINSASIALAQEFASVADPRTGKSAHGNVGSNVASISSSQIQQALEVSKRQYDSFIAKGYSPDAAWNSLSSNKSAMSQTNNITINGSSNPDETKKAVFGGINDANAKLVRNNTSAIR